MIKYKIGNILEVNEGIIAHGCNAQGKMGSGVALLIKETYESAYLSYLLHLKYCKKPLGTVDIIKVARNLYVANCITQEFYGRVSGKVYVDYDALANCFMVLNDMVLCDPKPLHIPMIGAGLANGEWEIIEDLINKVGPDGITCWRLP